MKQKNYVVAVMLSMSVFSLFGAHNFYVGATKAAIWQLILTLTFVGLIVSVPWVFVNWIQLLNKAGNYASVQWE